MSSKPEDLRSQDHEVERYKSGDCLFQPEIAMRIRVLSSPFSEDGELPWEYDTPGFLNWYHEVFRERWKRDNLPVTATGAIEDLRARGYEVEWDGSTYRGSQPFQREQLIFTVEAVLIAALDRVESGMPTSGITWQDRLDCANKIDADPKALSAYDRGALECTGMFLGVLCAQLTGDGLGIYDALFCADRFDEAVREWVERAWADEGKAVRAKINSMPQEGWRIGEVYEKYPDCRNHAEAFVKELFGDYLAKVESLFSDVGFELDDGGAICFPDANGDIRRIDSNGNTVEVRGIGDPGWNEWRDLFPDDALYYQPERAGHPHCGTSAAAINFFDVYRNRENAETAHPDCKILSFAFCDIEQPVFLDVEQPKYHAKSNDPESGLSANHNTEAAQLFRVRICGQPDADHILVRAVSMEDAAQVARDVREEGGTEARQVEIGVYVEPENCRTGLVYYPVQTERMFDISEEPIERNRPAQRDLR